MNNVINNNYSRAAQRENNRYNETSGERLISFFCVIIAFFENEAVSALCRAIGLALLAVVGRGMVKAKGTAARIFKAISDADVNIRMIDQGSSELNIIVGVEDHDLHRALIAIYDEFAK